ncbi:cysteine dioxygenase type 1-like isoform X2 [Daphnia pulicaria]|uniref:cysteine dioxygenase type 1-like isoform X2 n=1 Tax=Daphnia pulicaria TaxID=35523 RepID=UPI001EE9B5A4|nr:cysteine dioxygenase type 1-like isoform X2 [Daphnia pulicaria]
MAGNTLNELKANLHEAFQSDPVDMDHVKDLMERYSSNPADWGKFAIFDSTHYTRILVDEGNGKFNLILLCWGPGQGSPIHDHADAHCFMKMLDGTLKEVRYDWPSGSNAQELHETSSTVLKVNEVSYINDSIGLHQVGNTSDKGAVSLHLYSPPYSKCHTFKPQTGEKSEANITFWSKTTTNQSCWSPAATNCDGCK